MKIEIEVDERKVIESVVSKLYESLIHAAKRHMESEIKLELTREVRAVARAHVKELIDTFVFPDGRSFKQYVSDIFIKATTYGEKPRIRQLAEDILNSYARSLYVEVVEPYAKEFREKLKSRVLSQLFDG